MSLVINDPTLLSWTQHVLDNLTLREAKMAPICVFMYMRRLLESLPRDIAETLQDRLCIDEEAVALDPNALKHPPNCICQRQRPEPDELTALYWGDEHFLRSV